MGSVSICHVAGAPNERREKVVEITNARDSSEKGSFKMPIETSHWAFSAAG